MIVLQSLETSRTAYRWIWSNIPEDLKLRQHCCDDLKSRNGMILDLAPAVIIQAYILHSQHQLHVQIVRSANGVIEISII